MAEAWSRRERLEQKYRWRNLVGQSAAMLAIYKTIGRVAQSDATVLISGETGTGKELIAEGAPPELLVPPGPLIKVACASLPETLLESELFGHEKGSFTGAVTRARGASSWRDGGPSSSTRSAR